MAGRLTDRKKKKIVADYLELRSVNAAAKRNNVSWKKANEAIQEDKELTKKLEDKKAENTADILAYMESRRDKVCEIIGVALEVLPEKIRDARSASEVTTALGTIIDKWAMVSGGAADEVKEDGLSKSLKELAEELESDDIS